MTEIQKYLFLNQDKDYAEFQRKLIPTADPETVIGVRTPVLRKYAKELSKSAEKNAFLASLPHKYFDENQLHSFILALEKDYDALIEKVEAFLPYVDNWATCDQLSPKAFAARRTDLLGRIENWLCSEHTYTVRFSLCTLMRYYLDDGFLPAYLDLAASVRSDEYYIKMMQAWFFATALAKQYEHTLPYIENRVLEKWTHNKAIQKAVESYRISPEQKEYLKTLKN